MVSPSTSRGAATGTLRSGRSAASVTWMVLPLTCTVNWEAPITVARIPSRGSASEGAGDIAEVPRLAPVDVLRDAARERDRARRDLARERLGEGEPPGQRRWRIAANPRDRDSRERVDDLVDGRRIGLLSDREPRTDRIGGDPRALIDARDAPLRVDSEQPPAHGEGRGRDDAPIDGERELGRADADVHVENGLPPLVRERRRARAVRRERALEVVAGGGAHELPALRGEEVGDRAG